MTEARTTRLSRVPWRALPRLIERSPSAVLIIAGIVTGALGVLIVTRPLTSLWLLGLYVGVSAVAMGALGLAGRTHGPDWLTRVIAALWIVAGIAILVWLGRSLELLPDAIAVLLLIGGVGSIWDIFHGRVSERVLAAAWGGAQFALGFLALTWPDATVLIVAVVFGVRMIVFGGVLLIRGIRALVRRSRAASVTGVSEGARDGAAPAVRPGRRARAWADAARYALAAVVIAAAASAWWASGWLEDGAPVIDSFYSPPEDLPAPPGQLIRTDDYSGRIPDGGRVQRILYTTTDAVGRSAVASGLVISPVDAPPGEMPVIAWNHGTTGVARGCAPSLTDAGATRWAIPAIEQALARGWVVVATDYTGQGAPGTFPYLIGDGEARSSLDAVRAAQNLEGLRVSNEVVVWGHSQGGHAALWTAQIADAYAPELDVLGAAALSPVGDPLRLAEELSGVGGRGTSDALLSVLVSWVLVPYADTYPDVEITDYVAPGARTIVREMSQRCPTEPGVLVSVLAALGVSTDRPLYDADLTGGALGRRLSENAPTGPWNVPLLIAWGGKDEVIPPRLHRELVDSLCAGGADVRWNAYARYDHTRVMLPGSGFLFTLLRWSQERFDHSDGAVSDCQT